MLSTVFLAVAALTNVTALSDALQKGAAGEPFEIEATVVSDCGPAARNFAVMDSSGVVIISPERNQTNSTFHAGEIIRASGRINASYDNHIYADCTTISSIGLGTAPATLDATLAQIADGGCDARIVRTSGMLRDFFVDEIDDHAFFLILNDGSETLYAVMDKNIRGENFSWLDGLIGTRITISGLCDPRPSGYRRRIGRIIRTDSIAELKSSKPASTDPFDVPPIGSIHNIQPVELSKMGRRKAIGRVLAAWKKSKLILQTPENTISRVDLAQAELPDIGETIEVVGFPDTDLYNINLSRAIWRKAETLKVKAPKANIISAKDLTFARLGRTGINAGLHGSLVSIEGTVRSLPSIATDDMRLYIENENVVIPIDVSAHPHSADGIEIGCKIRATGICVMEVENWRPNLVFPHIKEVMIVTRTPGDIVVLELPPWWTPAKFAEVIGSLVAILLSVLLWNRSLHSLAGKRGKALATEEVARLASDLKSSERTRLSVELHDSIAQTLSGISMELDTALNGDEPLPPTVVQHLSRASKTLDSCRVELRNCIWDLRSRALDEPDMNRAIKVALGPTVGKTNLGVRFNVPRSQFTENTARTILNIVRELASNAIRHGRATEVWIAGSLDGETLRFSVRDNGSGFDPYAHPGVAEGHFGLQGIEERVAALDGQMEISSTPGTGTKVVITIHAAIDEDREKI